MPVEVAPPLPMTAQERASVERIARSSSPPRKVRQARALLLAADGVATNEVARRCGATDDSVRAWRRRFEAEGVDGLGRVAPGRGRRSWLAPGAVAEITDLTCTTVPDDGSTRWSTRSLAARVGVGKDTVARVWRRQGLRPWRREAFRLTTDPALDDRLVDLVGLYVDPNLGERAVVSCFDAGAYAQAAVRNPGGRSQAPVAAASSRRRRRTDVSRLLALPKVAAAAAAAQVRRRDTAVDVLRLFKQIDAQVPRALEIHVVVDDLSIRKAPELRNWLAHVRRRRWHVHLTPTSRCWDLVLDRWCTVLARRRRGGVSSNAKALADAIEAWASRGIQPSRPLAWHASP